MPLKNQTLGDFFECAGLTQARWNKQQVTIAKLPLAGDVVGFFFEHMSGEWEDGARPVSRWIFRAAAERFPVSGQSGCAF